MHLFGICFILSVMTFANFLSLETFIIIVI